MLKTTVSQGEGVECSQCGYILALGERYTYEALSGTVVRCPNCPQPTDPNGGAIMWPNCNPGSQSPANNCNESVMHQGEAASQTAAQTNNVFNALWKAIASLQERLEKLEAGEPKQGSNQPARKGKTTFYSVMEATSQRQQRVSKDHKNLGELLSEVIDSGNGQYELTKAGIRACGRDFTFFAKRPDGKTDRLFGPYLKKVLAAGQSKAA